MYHVCDVSIGLGQIRRGKRVKRKDRMCYITVTVRLMCACALFTRRYVIYAYVWHTKVTNVVKFVSPVFYGFNVPPKSHKFIQTKEIYHQVAFWCRCYGQYPILYFDQNSHITLSWKCCILTPPSCRYCAVYSTFGKKNTGSSY